MVHDALLPKGGSLRTILSKLARIIYESEKSYGLVSILGALGNSETNYKSAASYFYFNYSSK